jgi:hypothetical protein
LWLFLSAVEDAELELSARRVSRVVLSLFSALTEPCRRAPRFPPFLSHAPSSSSLFLGSSVPAAVRRFDEELADVAMPLDGLVCRADGGDGASPCSPASSAAAGAVLEVCDLVSYDVAHIPSASLHHHSDI